MKLLLFIILAFVVHSGVVAQGSCHPECSWLCDNPTCTASCEINCPSSCPSTPCDEQDCRCATFSEPEASNCTPPLSVPCTTCQIEQIGKDCKNSHGQSCACNLLCEQPCTWECQTPNCKQPTCQLQCEQPACDISVVFP